MKKYLSVLAAVVLLFSCGKEASDPSGDNQPQGGGGDKSDTEQPKGPTTTGSATNVTEWSAVLSAYANPTADMGTVTMGIIYSTDPNPTLDNGVQLTSKELDGNNMYTVKATQLASNTTYYYKSTLESAGVIRSGEVKSFKTKEIVATVTTGEATEIGKIDATLSGELLLNTTEDFEIEVGFLGSASVSNVDELIQSGTKYQSKNLSEGVFSSHLYIDSGTTYYYMAYASVHDKIVYGDIKEFRTLDLVELSVLEVEDITQTTASLYASFNREELSSLIGPYSLKWIGFIYSETEDSLEGLLGSGEVVNGWLWGNEFGITLYDLKMNTKYYYVAGLTLIQDYSDRKYESYSEVKSFETDAVDLGLSVKWSPINLGARNPEDYGDYFAWGDIEPNYISLDPLVWKDGKWRYDFHNYLWAKNWNELTKYCTDDHSEYWGGSGNPDNKTVLDREDDAVYVRLGGKWRMPTQEELEELSSLCIWTWTTRNGINGYEIKGPNGNSIFLPAAGAFFTNDPNIQDVGSRLVYWSSSLYDYPDAAFVLWGNSTWTPHMHYSDRADGIPIRPVREY